MPDVIEVNTQTGQVTERAFTAAERTQRGRDTAAAEQAQRDEEARLAARQNARTSGTNKLKALGLTGEEIEALRG